MLSNVSKITLMAVLGGAFICSSAFAQNADNQVKQTKSAKQRVAHSQMLRAEQDFENISKDYAHFKDYLQKEYGLGYALDMSFMPQYGAMQ